MAKTLGGDQVVGRKARKSSETWGHNQWSLSLSIRVWLALMGAAKLLNFKS